MSLDKCLRDPRNRVRQWQPIKPADSHSSTFHQQASHFGCRHLAVEPVPALSRSDHVVRLRWEARFLCRTLQPLDLQIRIGGQTTGRGKHPCIHVGTSNRATPHRELPSESSSTAAQIQKPLPGNPDAQSHEALNPGYWKVGPVECVILSRRPEPVSTNAVFSVHLRSPTSVWPDHR